MYSRAAHVLVFILFMAFCQAYVQEAETTEPAQTKKKFTFKISHSSSLQTRTNENSIYNAQYTLKDHLDNSRLTFGVTEKEYLAAMESELGNEEEAQFNNTVEIHVL